MTMTAVLVHGAWHGAWCWDGVVPLLAQHGAPAVTVELPLKDLHDDARHVRTVLDDVDGTAVLLGHSYGGAVITEAGVHDAVAHLVYLCAFQLDEGDTMAAVVTDGELPHRNVMDALVFPDDATMAIDPDKAPALFFNDCPPDVAAAATAKLRAMALAPAQTSPRSFAWRDRPSTYVVCTDDHAIHPDLQRAMAERASHVIDWPTSHSPFLSRPDLVADLVGAIANGVSP